MKLSPTTVVLLIAGVVVIVLIALFATEKPVTQPVPSPLTATQAAPVVTNSVKVSDQAVTDSVTLSASLTAGGYVVIHEATAEGTPGAVIGYTNYLTSGNYDNLTISLTKKVKAGATPFAMLHADDGDKTYGFPDEDLPLKDASGKIILQKFKVTS